MPNFGHTVALVGNMGEKLGGLGWKELSRRAWTQFRADRILDQSAMLSFYLLAFSVSAPPSSN